MDAAIFLHAQIGRLIQETATCGSRNSILFHFGIWRFPEIGLSLVIIPFQKIFKSHPGETPVFGELGCAAICGSGRLQGLGQSKLHGMWTLGHLRMIFWIQQVQIQ